jgi:hypothetical protein
MVYGRAHGQEQGTDRPVAMAMTAGYLCRSHVCSFGSKERAWIGLGWMSKLEWMKQEGRRKASDDKE